MKIMALLTCFNRKDKTIECIKSLIKDNSIDWNFIIVDDKSTDGTQEALKLFGNVTLITGNGHCFYSGGMRLAIGHALKQDLSSFDYIMMLNDDVLFEEGAISKLVRYLNNRNSIMVGATCDSNGKLSYGGVILESKYKPRYGIVMSKHEPILCDTFNANCVLIPTNIFKSLENINDIYEHAMGDFDYGLSAKRKGYEILVSNFFVGICNDNDISNTWRDSNVSRLNRFKKKESPKGLPFKQWFYYLNKNHSFFVAVIYSIVPYVKIVFKIGT